MNGTKDELGTDKNSDLVAQNSTISTESVENGLGNHEINPIRLLDTKVKDKPNNDEESGNYGNDANFNPKMENRIRNSTHGFEMKYIELKDIGLVDTVIMNPPFGTRNKVVATGVNCHS